ALPNSSPTAGTTTSATGFLWSYVLDVTDNEYIYITSASTGAVVGYFITTSAGTISGGTFVKLSDYVGVPGFDLLSPGAAVVVHRTDETGPRVSEYEGIPFQQTSYASYVPP